MGKKYLIDSNAIIDFFKGDLPHKGHKLLQNTEPIISIITRIEIFSSNQIPASDIPKLYDFIRKATIYTIDEGIALKAIDLRIKHKMKLPDAVIAATALYYRVDLITRNTSDFKNVKGLKLIDPHNI